MTGKSNDLPMPTEPRHEILLYWGDEDAAFMAEVPELPGCAADGPTREMVTADVEVVIKEWIETARELGRAMAEPQVRPIRP